MTDPTRIALAASALALAPAAASTLPVDCDEACLTETADAFLEAVAESDASLLDWNAYARWTLNGVELPFSEAVWAVDNSVSDAHRTVVTDPETGQIGIISSWTFDGDPALMAARLTVEFGRLSGAEMIVVTQRLNPPTAPGTEEAEGPSSLFTELGDAMLGGPVGSPAARAELVATAEDWIAARAAGGPGPVAGDCAHMANGETAPCTVGAFGPVDAAPVGRVASVDPARGLVFAVARYDDDGVRPGGAPGSTLAGHILKIEAGQVTRIETVGEAVHYRTPTGWAD